MGSVVTADEAQQPTQAQTTTKPSEATPAPQTEGATENKEKKEEKDEAETKEEVVPVGHCTDTKLLFQKTDKDGNRSWTENEPDDLEDAAENESTRKFAMIVRKKKPKDADSSKPLEIDSVIIQSPFLKAVLRKVFDKYPGLNIDVTRLVFHAPFHCFVHRWEKLAAARADPTNDELTKDHLELLCTLLEAELGDVIQIRADAFRTRKVDWRHVWTLFPPGETLIGFHRGKQTAMRFRSGYFGQTQCGKFYGLTSEYIDWDGNIMGWADAEQRIPEYLGTVSFSELPCFPLEYHPQVDAVKAALIARGRRFLSFAGYHYKAYSGTAVWHREEANGSTRERKEVVKSRIVIDGANWERENPDNAVYITALHYDGGDASGQRNSFDSDAGSDSDSDESASDCGSRANGCTDSDLVVIDDEGDALPQLTDEQAMMTGPVVRGYALKNKRWMEFYIDDIHEIQFDEGAFNSLVVPEEQKDLVLAFTQSQVRYKNTFDDVISGKGRGIIMLLSGGPGIGKTLTAESVAEQMKVPLYIMSAGDLGSDAGSVEACLKEVMSMVASWNAVLLLDECDVFLEARSPHEMERNRVVSVFLRTLEYYEGILFLTTNRINNMDSAFQSRIHLTLEYPPLDAHARAAVWRGFLDRTVGPAGRGDAAHEVTEKEVGQLSGLNLNGRQIKNVLKMSNLLAHQKGEKLSFKHLKTVLKVEGHSL